MLCLVRITLVKKKGGNVFKYGLRKITMCLVGCVGFINMKCLFEDLDFLYMKRAVAVVS